MTVEKEKKVITNESAYFLLPVFGIKAADLVDMGFINSYLSDQNREKVNETDIHIYLLFKPSKEKKEIQDKYGFSSFEERTEYDRFTEKLELLEQKDINKDVLLEDYDYEEGYTVLVFKFPERFREDYNTFLRGKYSKFSPEYIEKMPKTKKKALKDEILVGESMQMMVINKNSLILQYLEKKYAVDLSSWEEYWQIYSPEKETLNIENFE